MQNIHYSLTCREFFCAPSFASLFSLMHFFFFSLVYFSAVAFCVWFSGFFSDLKRKKKRSYREEPLKQRPSLGEPPPRTLYQQKSESRILECTGISFEVFRGLTIEGCLEIQWSVLKSLVLYLWNLHENSLTWMLGSTTVCFKVFSALSLKLAWELWVECSDVKSVLKSLGLY